MACAHERMTAGAHKRYAVQLGDEEATKQLLLSSDVIIFSAQAQLREAREALKGA